MNNYYKAKMELHHKQWSEAQNSGKETSAAYHMQEYLNYEAMYKQSTKSS